MGKKVQPRSALHHERPEPQRQHLKIGLILECQPSGPDQQVCKHLVEQLQPRTDVIPITLGDKGKLIDGCGKATALLLDVHKCQRVVIVWDVRPPWSRQNPRAKEFCLHEEREGIFQSLEKAGVNRSNVRLVCICQELEAWLIADNQAIIQAISRPSRKKPRIPEEKNPESVGDPKSRLIEIFRQHNHCPYQANVHALKIIKESNFKKLRRCQSFIRFEKAIDIEL